MDIIMNLNFKKEDLIFQEEVREFINDNLNHITKTTYVSSK